jgi:hypothetical protein
MTISVLYASRLLKGQKSKKVVKVFKKYKTYCGCGATDSAEDYNVGGPLFDSLQGPIQTNNMQYRSRHEQYKIQNCK